jgi:hypothetical protein
VAAVKPVVDRIRRADDPTRIALLLERLNDQRGRIAA